MHGAGIELAAISYDSPEILAAFARFPVELVDHLQLAFVPVAPLVHRG